MSIEYWKSPANAEWFFRIVARNGEIIAHSEAYKRKSNCLKTIAQLQQQIARAMVMKAEVRTILENPNVDPATREKAQTAVKAVRAAKDRTDDEATRQWMDGAHYGK